MSFEEAFARYQAIRRRLPAAVFPKAYGTASGLLEIAERFDVFVFDAFGVLNIGETPIPGAGECVAALRALGKHVFVLTNAASFDLPASIAKFAKLGFDFSADEIVTSRQAAEAAVDAMPVSDWAAASVDDVPAVVNGVAFPVLADDAEIYRGAGGFLLLSSGSWNAQRQAMLEAVLRERPRPLVVANPDLVAPREEGLSVEPGWYGHQAADASGIGVEFHGKPFPSVYDIIRARLRKTSRLPVDERRIAMIGDTLHTDILGGAAAGWSTVLVSDHGFLAGRDISVFIAETGIVPDWAVPSI
ncbi:MAG: HAD-IIA family hydrolase [Rhodobiaceae bacterium]|nr:HAD-IIA family hydrolase [Rhodobiaceae bacterium]MCC0018734.1 HAD-IIA family hydrolase [Rhodobiaceae bacterium]MCC0052170.1 HAD-IIA family hydrolase [Rhodobiaceae bacterium]MCC0061321.1 HAD-IIA family hydrolase [Rhodobiaceae bacterium]